MPNHIITNKTLTVVDEDVVVVVASSWVSTNGLKIYNEDACNEHGERASAEEEEEDIMVVQSGRSEQRATLEPSQDRTAHMEEVVLYVLQEWSTRSMPSCQVSPLYFRHNKNESSKIRTIL